LQLETLLSRTRRNVGLCPIFFVDRPLGLLSDSASLNGFESGEGPVPAGVLRLLRTRNLRKATRRGKEGKTVTPQVQSKKTLTLPLLTALVLSCFGLAPTTQAVNPPPDGGYANHNTAEGEDALFNLLTFLPPPFASGNTAVGWKALFSNAVGRENTAIGDSALYNNIHGGNTAVGFEALLTNTTGNNNTATGAAALQNNDTGINNTAIGSQALYSNTTAEGNTANGYAALYSNESGGGNTATGFNALYYNTSSNNTANGSSALYHNTSGASNTASGIEALFTNTTGSGNTANGSYALKSNDTGDSNTATGEFALVANISGSNNTAAGYQALLRNQTGDNNTATGLNALLNNTDGVDNTATGLNALLNNTSGNDNTANGPNALQSNTTGNDNTADGHDALFNNTTGSNNIAVGHGAGQNLTTGNNNIDIGFIGVPGEANTIRIGTQGTQTQTFIAGISGTALGSGVAVRVNSNGQLGTVASSARFKEEIKPMDKASEEILALRPVSFRYKKEIDAERTPQFGLVAEDVQKVNPDLVERDREGKPYSVRYEAVNAMLLNEFLKEHRIVEQLKKDFESKIAEQQKQIEALTAGLQKVSAQVELSKPAPRTVSKNQ
jgi:trimeric autotransporter adhesin